MRDNQKNKTPDREVQLLHAPRGEIRCRCGALILRACGPCEAEVRCRRCKRNWALLVR